MNSLPTAPLRYQRAPCVERELSNDRVLVQPLTAETPIVLAGSAPLIFELLKHCSFVDELVIELQRLFSDDPNVLRNGVESALASLLEASIVCSTP